MFPLMARVPDPVIAQVAAAFERVRTQHGLKLEVLARVMLMSREQLHQALRGRGALSVYRLMLLNGDPDTRAFHDAFQCEIAELSGFEKPDLVARMLGQVAIAYARRMAHAELHHAEPERKTA